MSSRMPLIVAMSGDGVRGVVRPAAGIGHVDDVAGPLVERDEAVRASADAPQFETAALTITRSPSTTGDIVRPPCVVNAANSSPNDRIPEQLAVAAERDRLRAAAERVDVAGLGIGRRRRPADAMRRHVALEEVELVLPDHLAGVGVERHDALLQVGAAAGRVLHVDAVAHHDRAPIVRRTARARGSSRRSAPTCR